jgi:hypothetical protein
MYKTCHCPECQGKRSVDESTYAEHNPEPPPWWIADREEVERRGREGPCRS